MRKTLKHVNELLPLGSHDEKKIKEIVYAE